MNVKLDSERRAILRWFEGEARRHARSDYAAWCTYFHKQLATGAYKDADYWNETGQNPNGETVGKTPRLPAQIIRNKV